MKPPLRRVWTMAAFVGADGVVTLAATACSWSGS
jgi:hypothetical protein